MKLLVLIIGVLITGIGVLGIAAPSVPLQIAHSLLTPMTLYIVAAIRVCVGLLFVWVAPSSRAPLLLRALGVLIVVAGLITPFFGIERSLAVLTWLSNQGDTFVRLIMCIPVFLGLFVVYTVAPRGRG